MKAEPWHGRFTFKDNKFILIDSWLSSLPKYIMGLYLLSEVVHATFDIELACFFWKDTNGH
jgi:hypothetical protein